MFLRKAGQSTQNCVNSKSDIVYILENGFETTLRSKADVLLNLWKRHISAFCTFLSDEVETISRKSEVKRSKLFKSKFAHRQLLKNGFEATLNSNTNLLCFWKVHFSVVCKLLSDEVGPLFGKVRKSVQNYLNQNLVIGSFLENGFKATLSSKTNVLSVSKGHFSVFCKVLSDEVETVFWENETMLRKLFP